MKYFTHEWASGELSDEACERIEVAYRQHLDTLLPKLPRTVADLATRLSLHDGLIICVIVDRKTCQLTLELRCGDIQAGYCDLKLTYSGVKFKECNLATLAKLARDRRTELRYYEVDVDDSNNYVHRILFWPKGEISIAFSGLQVTRTEQQNRCIPFVGDPYKVVG